MSNAPESREVDTSKAPRGPDPLPWIGLGLAAFVLLSYPWISSFTQRQALLGLPPILWYVFGVWACLILASALWPTEP